MSKNREIKLHSKEEFEKMRIAGKAAAEVLDFITPYIKPGVTTLELNDLCHNRIIEMGGIPAPLNYKGFPKSICTSVNHVVCHGIPSEKVLDNGDILNIDVTVIMDGWHGDTNRMYYVGDKVSVKAARLCQITYEAMMLGIEQVKPGAKLNEIGKAIQNYAEKNSFSVVRDFCGHGIGQKFHTAPNVLHYYDKMEDLILEEGMFFTVEPMINAGKYETKVLGDGWTAVTKDRSLSAQFEHTIAVTKDGFEIFTTSPKSYVLPPYS
ncbi:methionine aminopeptidase [endosymbiont of Acanthamoeba sp. UWC8]|uniref:type I methionyl aminopeptidase n=1 Tax=endosymbiont of Acanthamoeba sp. UWC8 TaxID=86106 RepID=UPI0004D1444B|nr:type I methionyl aminopeptidase [endosymbiont of Acanthamoeba sp. UWC8]AIF81941.1 methionine aminopeptidase [endosymbiont of Acanthamoeba sp. UWC8]